MCRALQRIDRLATDCIRISPARYAAVEMWRRAPAVALAAAVPLLVCAGAWLYLADYRFGLVGLMLVFMVYPGLALLGWLSMIAAPAFAKKLRPQRWLFGDSSVEIVFYSFSGLDDEPRPLESLDITFDSLRKFEIRGDFAYFFTELPTFVSKGDYYIIPASLLPAGLAQRLTELLYDNETD